MIINYEDETSYCPCCQLPFPTDEDMFPVCSANTELGVMVPGFPLFFVFIKFLAIYLFILSIIYFIPTAILIAISMKDYKENLGPDDSMFSLFSFGAFIHKVGDQELESADFLKR